MEERLKVFVSAYACEPGLGSEIGVGWHWVIEMSKYFELWVLTRESNRHRIEPWIEEHPEYKGIHFLYYDLPRWARFWKKGLRGVRLYYNLWQLLTDRIVERTMKQENIKVFHHLTYGNALWRVSSYGQRQCFIWGPIGGLETIPKEFSKHYTLKWRMVEAIRRLVASASRWNLGMRKKVRNADLILCKTRSTLQKIDFFHHNLKILFTDVAPDSKKCYNFAVNTAKSVNYISVGRLDAWRGFDLAIEAFAKVHAEKPLTRLTILGEGSDRKRLEKLLAENGLNESVSLVGGVEMDEYWRLMAEADVVVNASLKEGGVTVAFDAMSMGKPMVCVDSGGYTRYFSDDFAVVVGMAGRDEVIEGLKNGMLLLSDPEVRRIYGMKSIEAAKHLSWEQHGMEIRDVITECYENWIEKKV